MTAPAGVDAPSSTVGAARVSLGVGWFLVMMGALWVDIILFAGALAVVAGVAAWQSSVRSGSRRLLAGVVAAASVGATGLDPALAGILILAGVVGTVVVAAVGPSAKLERATVVGNLLAGWVPPVVGACSTIAVAHLELGSAVVLLWAMAMSDAGTYLVGYGTPRSWPGPLAGAVGVVVVIHMTVQLGMPPLDPTTATSHALVLAVGLFLGPVLCRTVVSSPGAALRRLDALVVAGPLWWVLVSRLIG